MQFSGKVTDSTTHNGLELCNVALLDSTGAVITGIQTQPDGTFNFSVANASAISTLRFSYVGFQTVTLPKQAAPYVVNMQPVGVTGMEAVITGNKNATLYFIIGLLAVLIAAYFYSKTQ